MQAALLAGGELPLAEILHGQQEKFRSGEARWRQAEPAMQRLATLLAPENARDVLSAEGDNWWIEVGPVSIQREEKLTAAITTRPDGRLRVAAFNPLDAKIVEFLIGMGQKPHPEHGASTRENNWEYALDCSASMGQHYSATAGVAYISYWESGVGMSADATELPVWRQQLALAARPANSVILELGNYYMVSGA